MRTVFKSYEEVGQKFAEASQPTARCRSLSFAPGTFHEENVLTAYSYNTRIAVHFYERDVPLFWLLDGIWTSTTSKHQDALRWPAGHMARMRPLTVIITPWRSFEDYNVLDADTVVRCDGVTAAGAIEKERRARKYKLQYRSAVCRTYESVLTLAKLFGRKPKIDIRIEAAIAQWVAADPFLIRNHGVFDYVFE